MSETKVWRAGLSNRFTKPRPAASTEISYSSAECVTTSTSRTRARNPVVACVA
jgi:hypothetical protein